MNWARRAALAGAAIAVSATAAIAQEESTNRVAANTDWAVFVEDGPRQCWAVSAPKETVNMRDGRVVAVRRGDIYMLVFYQPADNIAGQVQFVGGYPFASGSTVEVVIGEDTFEFFTEGESAWPASPEEDARVVAAMKAGVDAVVTGRSSRGTTTRDTFSLLGFTAAVDDAEDRCSG